MIPETFMASARRAERDAIRSALGNCTGYKLLDAGCFDFDLIPRFDGAGLTTLGASGLAIPFATTGAGAFLRGEVDRFPFREHHFDGAISAQILPHIQSEERRSAYLRELSRVLKPEGRLIITTMHHSFRFQRNGTPKEGWEGSVYYRRQFPDEFQGELEACFTVEKLHGFWIYLPKTYRLYMSLKGWNVYWERALRNLPLSVKYGKFLLAVCRPKQKETA